MPGRKVPAAVHGPKVSACVVAGAAAVVFTAVGDAGVAVAGAAMFVAGTVAGAVVAGVAMVGEPVPAGGVRAVVHPDERSVTTRATTPPVAAMIVGFMMSSYAL
jgi:hypothetical protein